jgi:transposase-like protein
VQVPTRTWASCQRIRNEVTRRDPRYQPELREQAKRLYLVHKLTIRQVAERMGLSRSRITELLEDAGVQTRRRGPRPKPPKRRRTQSTRVDSTKHEEDK